LSQVDQRPMTARVDEILNRRPAVGMAVGVVRQGSLEFFYGHGVANIGAKTPITTDTIFRVASITKTFMVEHIDEETKTLVSYDRAGDCVRLARHGAAEHGSRVQSRGRASAMN
jgi:hypothetical protein